MLHGVIAAILAVKYVNCRRAVTAVMLTSVQRLLLALQDLDIRQRLGSDV
ncbi:hypothetical protein [Candidatus Ichthyocystis hellenicum]|nr:hypothetical protein [Candidatus Ichthyocystis hellenicum]